MCEPRRYSRAVPAEVSAEGADRAPLLVTLEYMHLCQGGAPLRRPTSKHAVPREAAPLRCRTSYWSCPRWAVVTSKGGAASPEPAKAPTVSCSGAKCVPCQLAQSTRHVVPRGSSFPRSGSEMPRPRISSASSHSRRTGAGIEGQTARQASGEETGRERCQQQRCLCRRV
jgi:hypothetical protein